MPAWSQPEDLKTWFKRGFSLRGGILLLAVMAIFISEIRFSWVEMLMGHYLAATNPYRPESGNVWEQGHLRQVATQNLEQMVTQQLSAQREAREATSLPQLIDGLADARGTMISADHFKALYSRLPDTVAQSLFSPILMLRISADKSWERVYLERENGKVGIYLLDRGNNVLSYTSLNDQQIAATSGQVPTLSGSLDDQPEFAGRVYPAERFFAALDTLPPETQRGVLPHPGTLLAVGGTPVRVGISDEVNADTIRIAVEIQTAEGRRIVLAAGQEWAVWQVRMLLDPHLANPPSQRGGWTFRLRQGDR